VIENHNTDTARHASGLIPPYVRLATHLGYCCAIASDTTKDWNTRRQDITQDIVAALVHLDHRFSLGPYVSELTISKLQMVKSEIHELQEALASATADEATALADLQTAAHNVAWAMAQLENDLKGGEVVAGTEI
jgi:hypothetical protein